MATLPRYPPLEYSFSRQRMFDKCPRCWWFRYIKSWYGWEAEIGSEHRLCWVYGKAQSLSMLAGKVVHEAISMCLDETYLEDKYIKELATKKIDNLIQQAKKWDRDSPQAHKHFFLVDNIRNNEFPNEILIEDLKSDVIDKIEAFLNYKGDSWIEDGFRAAVQKNKSLSRFVFIDGPKHDFDSKKVYDDKIAEGNIAIWAIPDFVIEHEQGRYAIIDWKTSDPSGASDEPSFQLQIYGYRFARHDLKVDPSRIDLYQFHLPECKWIGGPFSNEAMERTKNILNKDIYELIRMKGDEPKVPKEKCPPTPSETNCKSCNYTTLCSHAMLDRKDK